MEKKINEVKVKIIEGLSEYMRESMERFTDLMSEISNDYLVKTKERELELKDEVGKLQAEKEDLIVYINGSKEKMSEFLKREKELNERELKLNKDEGEMNMIKEGVMADLKMIDASKKSIQKEKDDFEKEKQQFKVKQAMVEEQVKTLRKLNI
jgi:hypothetical protein